ncbi:DUF222 domain-containing protein, partial [Arthrobacter sp. MP_M7]|uniref:DUF222 domain-containing protein n=1 Tax=Arthrobacter sp. MP_M7 TaxID=3071716 RepID=UPI002DFE0B6E|nr:hypothetical protein [Arthrobacter sp. MP_M7]
MKDGPVLGWECVDAVDAVSRSVAALAALVGGEPSGAGVLSAGGGDPLRDAADVCLDALTEVARFEARAAALKVLLTAGFVHAAGALAPPGRSAQERSAQAMAVIAEIACALTVSEGTAAALVSESQALTTALPRTLAALQAGTISWQHARIVVDETAHLDAAGAAGL